MSLRRRQIDQPSLAQQIDLAPVFQRVFVDERPRRALRRRHFLQRRNIDLHIEVPGVRNDRSIFHQVEMFLGQHALVARDRAEHVAQLGRFRHRHHAEAVHHRFQRLRRIHFRNDHFRAVAARPARQSAAAPAVAGHHKLRPRQQKVRRPDNAVDRRLPRTVAIVEQMLGIGIVHRHDGKLQHAFLRHRPEPDHARRRLFRSADHPFQRVSALGVQDRHQVRAIIHGDVRFMVDRRQNVVVIRIVVLALDGEHRNALIAHQAGRNVVLRRKRVRGAQHHIRSAIAQANRQVRGFRGHMQAGRYPDPLQRLVLDELFPDDLQHFHGLVRPLNALLAQFGQF